MRYEYRSAIGQDSHRFMTAAERLADPERQLILAGIFSRMNAPRRQQ